MSEQQKMDANLRQFVTEALVSMISGVTGLVPPSGPGSIPDFVQAPIDRAVERISASLPVGVPDGWALVPVEPTPEIRQAIDLLCDDHRAFDDSEAFWQYLLDSSPAAPTVKAEQVQSADPCGLAPHAQAFNEAPAESLLPSLPAAGSAEEEVELVAWRYRHSEQEKWQAGVERKSLWETEPLMTVAQHERISDRRKALEKRAENMREYLRTNMEKAGISEIKALDGSFTAKLGKGRPSVVIDDEDALPGDSEFVRWTKAPNKTAIADAIKAGQEVPGAHLETKPSLTIK